MQEVPSVDAQSVPANNVPSPQRHSGSDMQIALHTQTHTHTHSERVLQLWALMLLPATSAQLAPLRIRLLSHFSAGPVCRVCIANETSCGRRYRGCHYKLVLHDGHKLQSLLKLASPIRAILFPRKWHSSRFK